MAKSKRVRITTPKGIAKFPRLSSPDTKFNPDGEYRVILLLDPEKDKEFLDELDAMADAAVQKAQEENKRYRKLIQRQEPYKMELDQDGEETGLVEVKFKMRARVKSKDGKEYNFAPALFDAQGKPIDPTKINIGGGSIIRVNFTPNPYFVAATKTAGISLQLNAVQVLELVQYNGGDAASFGFEQEEGFSIDDIDSTVDDSDDFIDDVDDDNDDTVEEDITEEDF